MNSPEQIIFHQWNEDLKPLVSIVCFAYNHELYIRNALESFINQKTNFRVEIIIHDDASKDNTANIIKSYVEQYPNLFNPVYQKVNQRSLELGRVTKMCFNKARGKYIALCEGDDYWTDPYKLQKQVDFLEENSEYSMICTKYKKLVQSTQKFIGNDFNKKYENEVKFEDYILDMSSIGTATVVLRKAILEIYQKIINCNFVVGDTPLWLFISATSKIAVLPEETSVYRILDDSACHFSDPEKHYAFVKKGFFIADYFLNKYATENKELEKRLTIKKLRADLFHGYRTLNKKIAWQAYFELNKYNLSFSHRISSLLYCFGSTGKQLQRLTGFIFKFYSSR